MLWKAVLSPDFMDGRFFRRYAARGPAHDPCPPPFPGSFETSIAANRNAIKAWPAGVSSIDAPRVIEPPRLRPMATFLTWSGGIALEGLIAIVFLAPLPSKAQATRPLLILAFCVAVYALAPVASFAWLLLIMSLAALPADTSPHWRQAHAAVAVVVLLWAELPWSRLPVSLPASRGGGRGAATTGRFGPRGLRCRARLQQLRWPHRRRGDRRRGRPGAGYGITLFDTADIYGERRVGDAPGKRRQAPQDVVIATRRGRWATAPRTASPGAGSTAPSTRSLERLGTDWIDVYQLHFPDPRRRRARRSTPSTRW